MVLFDFSKIEAGFDLHAFDNRHFFVFVCEAFKEYVVDILSC